ncbi:hypothetical protein [uncultured Winogradskyella sp.]|uniref:hypothetical protein n=1 Tax=uncultured Winogradskyella sp. TaxID=395353 RepID=UPI00262BF848|nr:hypothetical protein [uncultured Winogradskyella sp.]
MPKTRICKHCGLQFESRRSNHLYCEPSCRTKASYKRNNYKYVPGHYQKGDTKDEVQLNNKSLVSKRNHSFNSASITNVAIGTAAADTAVFAAKKIFAPNMLPATKGDIKSLRELILGKYLLIKNLPQNRNGEFPYFDIENKKIVYLK